MTTDILLDAIGMIDDDIIQDAKKYYRPVSRKKVKWSIIAACFALLVSLFATAYAAGWVSFEWVGKLFGTGHEVERFTGKVVSVDKSAVSSDISLTINSIVTDGSSIYIHFSIDTLPVADVIENLKFGIDVSTIYGYGGSGSITHIQDEKNIENAVQEYVLRYTVSGMKKSLLGQTITLTARHYEYFDEYDGPVQKGAYTNEWAFKIKLNDFIESVNYKLQDGTMVIITPISVVVEQTRFFYDSLNGYRAELADGNFVELSGQSSYESGSITDTENEVPLYQSSTIMFTNIVDPNNIIALWVGDTRYELITE